MSNSSSPIQDFLPEEEIKVLNLLFSRDLIHQRHVMDVGCGKGDWSLAFEHLGARRVTGLDIDFTSLQTGLEKKNRRNSSSCVEYVCSNIENLPIPNGTADMVFSWGCLHYADAPEKGFKEMLRICSPSGQVVVLAHAANLSTIVQSGLRAIIRFFPEASQRFLLELCIRILRIVGLIPGLERFRNPAVARQRLVWRWFYPGTLHTIKEKTILDLAQKLGWKGVRISLDYPKRFSPSNSFLLRFVRS